MPFPAPSKGALLFLTFPVRVPFQGPALSLALRGRRLVACH